jgi:hypothetical protein
MVDDLSGRGDVTGPRGPVQDPSARLNAAPALARGAAAVPAGPMEPNASHSSHGRSAHVTLPPHRLLRVPCRARSGGRSTKQASSSPGQPPAAWETGSRSVRTSSRPLRRGRVRSPDSIWRTNVMRRCALLLVASSSSLATARPLPRPLEQQAARPQVNRRLPPAPAPRPRNLPDQSWTIRLLLQGGSARPTPFSALTSPGFALRAEQRRTSTFRLRRRDVMAAGVGS